jgi:hypothetical protein
MKGTFFRRQATEKNGEKVPWIPILSQSRTFTYINSIEEKIIGKINSILILALTRPERERERECNQSVHMFLKLLLD